METPKPSIKPRKEKKEQKSSKVAAKSVERVDDTERPEPPEPSPSTIRGFDESTKAPQTFEQYYLSSVTKEFASDIDKLRAAPDFRDHFVPILVEALGQGASIYSGEEKARVLGTKGG